MGRYSIPDSLMFDAADISRRKTPSRSRCIHRARDHPVVIGEFTTERLRIRPMGADDIDLVVQLNSDTEVMKHLSGRASSAEESATELRGALGTRWLVFVQASDEFLGWVGAVPVAEEGEIAG